MKWSEDFKSKNVTISIFSLFQEEKNVKSLLNTINVLEIMMSIFYEKFNFLFLHECILM